MYESKLNVFSLQTNNETLKPTRQSLRVYKNKGRLQSEVPLNFYKDSKSVVAIVW